MFRKPLTSHKVKEVFEKLLNESSKLFRIPREKLTVESVSCLRTLVVIYEENGIHHHFKCKANNAANAVEQCLKAHPDCIILTIELDKEVNSS